MKSSAKIGDLIGIPIEINISWFIIFALVTWTLASAYFPAKVPGLDASFYYGGALVTSLFLFLSLVVHELAHSAVAIKNQIPIKKITLFIFGGVAQMEKEPESPQVEFKMALAGPAASLALSIFFFMSAKAVQRFTSSALMSEMLFYLSFMNMSVVLFNIVPGFPLDGGRILRAGTWRINDELKSATRIATWIGKIFAYLLITAGIALLLLRIISPLTGVWLIVIGFFLHEAAEMSYQQLILKKALVGTPVRDVMQTNLITVTPDIALDVLVNDYFYKYRYIGFPVVEHGILRGIVNLQGVKTIPSSEWPKKCVLDAMSPPRDDLLVAPDKDSLDALVQMTRSGLGRLLVVENGCLLGLATQRDLLKLFEIKTHLCADERGVPK